MLVMLTTFHETPPAAPPPTTTTTTTAKEEGGYMTTFPVKHVKCPKFSSARFARRFWSLIQPGGRPRLRGFGVLYNPKNVESYRRGGG